MNNQKLLAAFLALPLEMRRAIVDSAQNVGGGSSSPVMSTEGLDMSGVGDVTPPELMQASYADDRPKSDGRRWIASVVSEGPTARSVARDFNAIGYAKSWRNAISTLSAIGIPSDAQVDATGAGATRVSTFTETAPHSLGIMLTWNETLLTSLPFNLVISTSGWVNVGTYMANSSSITNTPTTLDAVNNGILVNRSITIFNCGLPSGGRLFLPWAKFRKPSMTDAMPVIAVPIPDLEAAGQGLVTISGLPLGIQATFGFTVNLMTAESIALNEFARLTGIFSGFAQRAAAFCGAR